MDHATGWSSKKKRDRLYRNHYVAGDGHDSMPALLRLCAAGLMQRRKGNAATGGDDLFNVTEAGIETLKRWRP